MNRLLFTSLFCVIAASTAVAQTTWSYLSPASDRTIRVTDIHEHSNGTLLLCAEHNLDESAYTTRLVSLDTEANPTLSRAIWSDGAFASAYVMLGSTISSQVQILGALNEDPQMASMFRYTTNPDLQPIDSSVYVFNEVNTLAVINAVVTSDGRTVAAASAANTVDGWTNTQILLELSEQGDSLHSDIRFSNGVLTPRDIALLEGDTLLVSTLGIFESPYFPQWSFSCFSKFNTGLDMVGGFISRPFDGGSSAIGFGNTLLDGLHMSVLESANLIITGNPSGGEFYRTVVLKLGPSGEWKGVFTPQSEYPTDHPAVMKSCTLANDHVLVASMENLSLGQISGSVFIPDHPNQVKIFKLDTALNVICTNIVDGFVENAYYWVDRIKATSDGGYLLCGGRFDLDQPNSRLVGWVQKFGPDDCFTSIEEGFHDLDATVSPNPGTDHMRVQLNGPIVSGFVSLWDMNGREVGRAALSGNSADLDTEELEAGVYAYRVTDAKGELLANGRWVKAE